MVWQWIVDSYLTGIKPLVVSFFQSIHQIIQRIKNEQRVR